MPEEFIYTDEQSAAFDELDKHGDLTAEQIRRRIGLSPVAHVIEVEFIPEKTTVNVEKIQRTPRKPRLGWRGRLMADEPPKHIRRQLL